MKQKLKIILSIYAVFQIVLACRCPEPTYYNWEVKSFSSELYYDHADSTTWVHLIGDSIVTELISTDFLSQFGPNKAYATSKCETEKFYLQTKFNDFSIKSSVDFNTNEPAGSELKHHFKFKYPCCNEIDESFENIANRYYNKEVSFYGIELYAELLEYPTNTGEHTFTCTLYLEGGDSIVSVTNPFSF